MLRSSTGPRTEAGKERASRNAVRHGLTAETVIEPLEDAEDYQAFEEAVAAGFDAETAVERELIFRLASLLWRLRRATSIETGLFQIGSASSAEHEQCLPGTKLRTQTPNAVVRIVQSPTNSLSSTRNTRTVRQRGIFQAIAPTGRRFRSICNYCLPSVSWGSRTSTAPSKGSAVTRSRSGARFVR